MTPERTIHHSKPCIGDEEIAAVTRVLRSGNIAQGKEVEAFEHACAEAFGRKHAVAVSSGTAALHLALITLNVRKGDPVAVPSYACAALLYPIIWQQADPVLCDIRADYNLDPRDVPGSSRAVIMPHLFGAPLELPREDHIIEDIAQAMGGPVGRATQVVITSFYATKMLATGEGGMLLTDDAGIADHARDLRDYDNRDDFSIRYSYKTTDFQAAMGREQLKKLPRFVARRRSIAERYREAFRDLPLHLPGGEGHVYFRYVVATPKRDALEARLNALGVEAKRPVHRPAHHYLGGDYPIAERAHQECLSLPIYPAMVDEEVEYVIESVVKACDALMA